MQKQKALHFSVLILLTTVTFVLSLVVSLNVMWGVILFMLVPSVYLSFLIPHVVARTLLTALIVTIPLWTTIGLIGISSNIWFVESIFFFRFFGVIPVEEVMWFVLSFYMIVLFYEYFSDTQVYKRFWNTRLGILMIVLWCLAISTVILFYSLPTMLVIPYAYMWIGTVFAPIPIAIAFFRRPHFAKKFFLTAVFFFIHSLLIEIAALKLGWWHFPTTDVVGNIHLFGVSFPFEEMFFWMGLIAFTTLSYYEFFIDDEQ